MTKKAVPVILIVLLVAMASGCSSGGGEKPTLKEEVSKLDTALAKYNDAKNLYNAGQYQNAKDEFIACVDMFKACNSAFGEISKGNITGLEKRNSDRLASCSLQYAYASAYMRDSCTGALQKNTDSAYGTKVSADEFEQTARLTYTSAKEELQGYWDSQK